MYILPVFSRYNIKFIFRAAEKGMGGLKRIKLINVFKCFTCKRNKYAKCYTIKEIYVSVQQKIITESWNQFHFGILRIIHDRCAIFLIIYYLLLIKLEVAIQRKPYS